MPRARVAIVARGTVTGDGALRLFRAVFVLGALEAIAYGRLIFIWLVEASWACQLVIRQAVVREVAALRTIVTRLAVGSVRETERSAQVTRGAVRACGGSLLTVVSARRTHPLLLRALRCVITGLRVAAGRRADDTSALGAHSASWTFSSRVTTGRLSTVISGPTLLTIIVLVCATEEAIEVAGAAAHWSWRCGRTVAALRADLTSYTIGGTRS